MSGNFSFLSDTFLLQFTLLLLVAGIIAVGVLAYVFQRREHTSEKRLSRKENELKFAQVELNHAQEDYRELQSETRRLQAEVDQWKGSHAALYSGFEQLYISSLLERWFGFLENTTFRNRSEIGAFLLYPMLWFLGYSESAFHLDQPVTLLGASKGPAGYVSCVVYGVNESKVDVPLFLLDTISPDENLTSGTVDEIVVKAFSTKVVKFGITNGDEFVLYNLLNRGTNGGRVRQFPVKNIRKNWTLVCEELHPGSFQF